MQSVAGDDVARKGAERLRIAAASGNSTAISPKSVNATSQAVTSPALLTGGCLHRSLLWRLELCWLNRHAGGDGAQAAP